MRGKAIKFLWLLGFFCPMGDAFGASVATGNSENAIAAIENGILPAVEIEGRPLSRSTLAQRMQTLHVPGLSIAFIHNGRLEWTRTYGVVAAGGLPITVETRFQATQLAMPLTALGALHQVQIHSLALDGDINNALTSWHLPENQFTQGSKVTLRELLDHSAGITVRAFPGYQAGAALPTLHQLLDGTPPAVNAPVEAGEASGRLRYSSGAYEIVEQMLEDTSHTSFTEFMHDNIFSPLAMDHSNFEQAAKGPDRAFPSDASGQPFPHGSLLYPALAATGLWSTPSDMAQYILEIQRALAGRSKLISKDLATAMITRAKSSGFGLGLQIGGAPQHPFFQYGAASQGYVCSFTAYNEGDGLVVMTNGDNGAELIQEILRTVSATYGWPDFQPTKRKEAKLNQDILDKYVGYYRLGRYRYVQVKRAQDHLALQFQDEAPRDLYALAEQVWFFPDNNEIINFDNGPDDRAKSITDHLNGVETSAIRTDEATAKALGRDLKMKLQSNAPDPQAEKALAHYIDELQHGAPDYDEMDPGLAQTERQNLPDYRAILNRVGALKSLTFAGVAPNGADIYRAVFEKGSNEWRILLGANGQLESLAFGPNG